jgi:thiamine pyrophosphate-dependent acetolactate synthase large subunit-like protein
MAEVLGAPIVKALLGKAAVPDDSPYTTGGIGLLGTRPSQEALEECDTLLLVGTSFPCIDFCPKPGQARAVSKTRRPSRAAKACAGGEPPVPPAAYAGRARWARGLPPRRRGRLPP